MKVQDGLATWCIIPVRGCSVHSGFGADTGYRVATVESCLLKDGV